MDSITDSVSALRDKKRATFEKLMRGDHILVHLDSTKSGVVVPNHLGGNPALILKLSYNFQGSTQHDEVGIIANLIFSGRFYECVIPWDSIWGITDEKRESALWIESLPDEIRNTKSLPVGTVLHMEATDKISESERPLTTDDGSKNLKSPPMASTNSESMRRESMRKAILRRVK